MTQMWRIRGEWESPKTRDQHCAMHIRNCNTLSDDRRSEAMNSVVLAALRAAGFVETADEFERCVL